MFERSGYISYANCGLPYYIGDVITDPEEQRQLVRPFAIPRPTRQVVLATNKDFIRHSLLCVLKEEIKAAVPKEMLSLQSIQCLL